MNEGDKTIIAHILMAFIGCAAALMLFSVVAIYLIVIISGAVADDIMADIIYEIEHKTLDCSENFNSTGFAINLDDKILYCSIEDRKVQPYEKMGWDFT